MSFKSPLFILGFGSEDVVVSSYGFLSPLPIMGFVAPSVMKACVLPIFDIRISGTALQTSEGKAIGNTDLGAISYVYNDMKNNSGDLTLPYG